MMAELSHASQLTSSAIKLDAINHSILLPTTTPKSDKDVPRPTVDWDTS
jgi:hypothetical protein